jgi:hypothetical protein
MRTTSDEVKDLRREAQALKEVVADLTLENRLLKKAWPIGSSPTPSAVSTNRSEGSFAVGKRMAPALLSTGARLKREKGSVLGEASY